MPIIQFDDCGKVYIGGAELIFKFLLKIFHFFDFLWSNYIFMDINCLSQLCKIVKRAFSENGCGGILIGIRFGGGVI